MNGISLTRRGSFGSSQLRKSSLSFTALPEVPVISSAESPEMVVASSGRGSSPNSVLFEAIRQQRFRQATLLLEAGSNSNARRERGQTCLIYCCEQGEMPRQIQTKFAKLLLDYGADPNLTDDRGLTPLMHAAILGLKDLANSLLEHDELDPGLEDHDGNTASMYAAMYGRRDILIFILEKFRQVGKSLQLDKKNKQGRTALNLAIRGQHESCIRLLVREARQFPLVSLDFPDPCDLDRCPTPGNLGDDEDCFFDSSVELEEFEPLKIKRPESQFIQPIRDVYVNENLKPRQGESFWVYKFDKHQKDTFNPALKCRRKMSVPALPLEPDSKDEANSCVEANRSPLEVEAVDRPSNAATRTDDPERNEDEAEKATTVVKDSVVWHKSLRRFNKRCSRIYNSESLPCIVLASNQPNRMVRKRASWTSDDQFDLKSLIPKLRSSLGFHENSTCTKDQFEPRRNSLLSSSVAT